MFTGSISEQGAFVIRQSIDSRSEKRMVLERHLVHRIRGLATTNVVGGQNRCGVPLGVHYVPARAILV